MCSMSSAVTDSDLREFVQLSQEPPFSLALLDFAGQLDRVLVSSLPNRMDLIVAIVEQAFGVQIESHRMLDKIAMMKTKTFDGGYILQHNKDINVELAKFMSNLMNLFRYPKAAPYCLPISLHPVFQCCPQYVSSAISKLKRRESICFISLGAMLHLILAQRSTILFVSIVQTDQSQML